jgi:phospholipid-translocating ATPase
VEAEFPFDSTRKRMSLIVRDESENFILLCKGADTVMYDRIIYEKSDVPNLKVKIEKDLYDYSCEGLRTLMMTQRNISKDEFLKFKTIYD